MNDEYNGIFDHLNPDDFVRETSAVDEVPRVNVGVEKFNQFVDEQLRAVRFAYLASDGQINPIAVVASPTVQRMFAPDDDETLGQYLQRLHREANLIGARWLFISKQTLVGSQETPASQMKDVNDPESVGDESALTEGVYWYAERREGDERHHRHGIIPELAGRNVLGEMTEGPQEQTVPMFAKILDPQ